MDRLDNAARDPIHRKRTSSRPSVSVCSILKARYLANCRLFSYWEDLLKRIQSGEIDPLKMVTVIFDALEGSLVPTVLMWDIAETYADLCIYYSSAPRES